MKFYTGDQVFYSEGASHTMVGLVIRGNTYLRSEGYYVASIDMPLHVVSVPSSELELIDGNDSRREEVRPVPDVRGLCGPRQGEKSC